MRSWTFRYFSYCPAKRKRVKRRCIHNSIWYPLNMGDKLRQSLCVSVSNYAVGNWRPSGRKRVDVLRSDSWKRSVEATELARFTSFSAAISIASSCLISDGPFASPVDGSNEQILLLSRHWSVCKTHSRGPLTDGQFV